MVRNGICGVSVDELKNDVAISKSFHVVFGQTLAPYEIPSKSDKKHSPPLPPYQIPSKSDRGFGQSG